MIALPLLWIGGVIILSILFRNARDKPIFPRVPEGAIYVERRGSGCNLGTWWGRLGGARNCLLIAVTRDSLLVTPRFPFNLMFLPEVYGLEFDVPLSDIVNVEQKRILWQARVVISTNDGARFQLYPRRIDAFIAALKRT